MKVIYRISDGGYKKQKPSYITKIDCFENALKHFHDFYIIQDGELKDENILFNMIRLADKYNIKPSAISNWKKALFEGAVSTFSSTQKINKEKDKTIKKLEETLQKRDTLIADIVEDNIHLRKKYNGEN